jgi:hypothetical protein
LISLRDQFCSLKNTPDMEKLFEKKINTKISKLKMT